MSQQQQQSETVGNGITTNSNFVSLRLIFKGFLESNATNGENSYLKKNKAMMLLKS